MQNVGRPRFYVDIVNYQKSLGIFSHDGGDLVYDVFGLKTPQLIEKGGSGAGYSFNASIINERLNWAGIFGHNLNSSGLRWYPEGMDGSYIGISNKQSLINATFSESDLDGFGIVTTNDGEDFDFSRPPNQMRFYFNKDDNSGFSNTFKVGSICYGKYYDMPHSPDLNLKLSYEYDGVKTIQTKGGATLSNATYTKPADWGDGGAWQLGSDESGNPISNLRSGRRVWDLSFSYLSSDDLMPVVAATTNLGAGDNENIDFPNENTLLDGTDFFSQVINRTMGGHLPFIFQADGSATDPKPDQFAIARFDMNSFSYDQVANNVYNVKLKIREVW